MEEKKEEKKRVTTGHANYSTFKNEAQMPEIMAMYEKDLSEPYSIFTYRYFINNWPNLCVLAHDAQTKQMIGAIVCKLDPHKGGLLRYIYKTNVCFKIFKLNLLEMELNCVNFTK